MATSDQPPRPTELAHLLLQRVIAEGDLVIDATAGNGHDTVFLARCAGKSGRVLAFDVQQAAIEASRRLIESSGVSANVEFFQKSHIHLPDHVSPGSVAAIMFNLGYLPGSDQSVITTTSETLLALEAAVQTLRPGGWLCVVCYPGHDGGNDEASAVESWLSSKPGELRVARYGMLATLRPAPFLLTAVKRVG
ncbi:MAG: rRNA methyltransferase [Verrucomicrobiales bacterium VVV1]|nr:MAG: rRNA methyltransferase [Verrucomicrobiales bacterium VVV1]